MDSSKTVALSGRVSEVRDSPEGESGRGRKEGERERGRGWGWGWGWGWGGVNVFHILHCALREKERGSTVLQHLMYSYMYVHK